MTKKFDFGIIGSGPAGYTAAIRASQLGKSVVLFEKDLLGGVCLNKGCIPTKAILRSVKAYNSLKKISNFGVNVENYSLDFAKVAERKDKTVEKIRKSLEMLLKSYGIEIVYAEAKIITDNNEQKEKSEHSKRHAELVSASIQHPKLERSRNEFGMTQDSEILENVSPVTRHSSLIQANGETYECMHTLVATGAEPRCVGGFEFDHKFILSSDDVLNLTKLPEKVLIVGSGAIGVEWARIFSSFEVKVTVVEIAPKLLPPADVEISQRLERTFKMAKIKYYLETSVKEINGKKVSLSNNEILEPDFVLFATGRKIHDVGVETPTYEKIGDCYGSIQLAHFASHQGRNVVNKIVLGEEEKEFITPAVVYGSPEIAWAGKCEQDLEGTDYKKSVFPLSALGKAHCDGDLEGFVKLLADMNGNLLGAHIIGAEASALLHQLTIAMQNGIKINDLKHCCFAHPTYSEGVYEALLGLDGESLSLLKSY